VTIFHQANKGKSVAFIAINQAFVEWGFTPSYHIYIPWYVEKFMPLFSLFFKI
jgi:hypothetical protein